MYAPLHLDRRAAVIEDALATLGLPASITQVTPGPTVTTFNVRPGSGLRVSRFKGIGPDLSLALAVPSVRVVLPGSGSPDLCVEIPNRERHTVLLRDLLRSPECADSNAALPLVLGQDMTGHPLIADLVTLPHLLLAGATGTGKSTLLHALLASLITQQAPDDVRLLIVDLKVMEFTAYRDLPHLLRPVMTDVPSTTAALFSLQQALTHRFDLLSRAGARDLASYNATRRDARDRLPVLVLVIDEMADLMLQARALTEQTISRLAALGRATGIHLIVATQRPSVNVITGVIKANFPARLAFAVRSGHDSRTILDTTGAEHLLGAGDALWLNGGARNAVRLQAPLVTDGDITTVVRSARRIYSSDVYPRPLDGSITYPYGGH